MTQRLFLFTLILLFSAPKTEAQNNKVADPIPTMLKDFYTAYVTEISKMPEDLKKIALIKQRFCTYALLSELRKKELDYDPFLNAQDVAEELLKTLKIEKSLKKESFYNVSYMDNFSRKPVIISMSVIKVDGRYKINKIL